MSFTPPVGAATTTTRGIIKLAGDVSGTADAVTVPGLASKANTSHTHAASDVTSGTLDAARLPVSGVLFASGTTRPTSRTDVMVIWTGATDPGSAAIDNVDVWLRPA